MLLAEYKALHGLSLGDLCRLFAFDDDANMRRNISRWLNQVADPMFATVLVIHRATGGVVSVWDWPRSMALAVERMPVEGRPIRYPPGKGRGAPGYPRKRAAASAPP